MEIIEYDKYSIAGKIININDSSTLTISVTFPFISVIKFNCSSEYYNTLHPPVSSKYNWIDWVQGVAHPSVTEASVYYNTNDKCFYKKESGSESEWECTDFDDIYSDNPHLLVKNSDMQEKYQFFVYRYKSILHKEQLCYFSAYAIDTTNRNWHSIHNKQVERHPDDYFWIYDPDTFHGEKWDAGSIDGLVREIRPSRDCLEELLKRHDAADEELKRKEREERRERIKSIPGHLQNWLTKYDKIWYILTSSLVGALVTLIVSSIINRNG